MKFDKVNRKRKFRGVFNKYIITFLFIYFLLGIGISYSYYAYQVQEEEVIAGNVISIDADLDVELVVGNTTKMVPMMDAALSNAINGVGSENGACIDSVGNLSCQVYKITLTNNGSRLKNVEGTIRLYAQTGSNNAYSNLKWRKLSNTTTITDGSTINGMNETVLVSGLTVESKETVTWYIAVWLSETDYDQTNTDKGKFGGTVTFGAGGSSTSTPFIDETLATMAVSDENIDFSAISSSTNGEGVYLRSGTEDAENPIYYYRGAVDNNLIFADTCWKIVRTTETGGLKLIYNGTPTNGQCNNTGTSTQIGTKAFNSSYTSPAYVGYMYGTPYEISTKSMSSDTTTYYYGNDVTYSNGTYTLTDTISSSDWSTLYNGGLNNYHYTCFSTSTTCNNVYYIYNTSSSTAYYIGLTGGKKIATALTEMLDTNVTSSTIKGNNTTAGTLDYWYYTNIEQKGYSSYIEDTVWCNDRSSYSLGGFNPDGGVTNYNEESAWLLFSTYERVLNSSPSLTCSRDVDKFTVSTSNGNGNLDYPVGLLTLDEVILAGADSNFTSNSTYYLYSGENYWAGSPIGFYFSGAGVSLVSGGGALDGGLVDSSLGVRPSVSLAPGFSISGGDGSVTTPYIVG